MNKTQGSLSLFVGTINKGTHRDGEEQNMWQSVICTSVNAVMLALFFYTHKNLQVESRSNHHGHLGTGEADEGWCSPV